MSVITTAKDIILIVDDTPANLGALFDFLADSGFKVLVARDGESAIQKVAYARPDIILLDVIMPGIDGFETCRRLKATESTRDIPVIFMTALTDTVDKVTGLNLGAVDYLTKPIQHEEVLARVTLHLNLRKLNKKLQEQNLRLEVEITERASAQAALQQLASQLEQRVEARTAELSQSNQRLQQEIAERLEAEAQLLERTRLAELNAGIGAALIGSGTLQAMLGQCAEAVVKNLDAAFARIWTLNEAENVLELQASAGMYTHLNGAHSRIPVGKLKIGWIAQHRQPQLTNNVIGDPQVNEQEWASREGMVAFAGYPLIVEERLVGAIALFARQPLPEVTLQAIASVANNIAFGIQSKWIESQLQESEQRFRQMAENIREVLWMTDPSKQQMFYISPAYEVIWGRTCQSLYQQPLSFLDAVHPEDRERVRAAFDKQITGEYDQEYRIVQPDGCVRWIRDRAFPIKNEAGQVYRIVGTAEDITEQKQAQENIYQAIAKEKELVDLKSRFITTASHEFRTPLTTILGSAEAIERYYHKWTEEKKFTYLKRIQASVQHMTQLLNDVLVIAKAESGKLEFNPAPLDLIQFCRELTEEMQLRASNQHAITLNILSAAKGQVPGSVIACMDEKLLRQIFSNLISNAMKYSPPSSEVYFKLAIAEASAIFQIQDSGIGIPPEDQERLFETFHRSQNVGNIPGTGLGLAIVKNSVNVHGGKISVHSEVGKGTTFTVLLPLKYQIGEKISEENFSN